MDITGIAETLNEITNGSFQQLAAHVQLVGIIYFSLGILFIVFSIRFMWKTVSYLRKVSLSEEELKEVIKVEKSEEPEAIEIQKFVALPTVHIKVIVIGAIIFAIGLALVANSLPKIIEPEGTTIKILIDAIK